MALETLLIVTAETLQSFYKVGVCILQKQPQFYLLCKQCSLRLGSLKSN